MLRRQRRRAGVLRRRDRAVRARPRRRPAAAHAARSSGCSSALILAGSVVGNLRSIALATSVTLLVPAEHRDRANGMIGTVMGISFTVTSVLSGLVVGHAGHGLGAGHRRRPHRGRPPAPAHDQRARGRAGARATEGEHASAWDFRGALGIIRRVPGLFGLIGFAAFNNLVGGIFMALMDAYGLVARVGGGVGDHVRRRQHGLHRRRPVRGQARAWVRGPCGSSSSATS